MNEPEISPQVAQIESGDYFGAGRSWYSEIFHVPVTQRSYYIVVIVLSLVNVYFAVESFLGVFPISVPVPFVTYANNLMEDIPHIRKISRDQAEDKNVAVMKFLIASYVINRESYELSQFELRYRNIWSQSATSVFDEYKKQIDTSNPYSYYRLYTNTAKRVIIIDSLDMEDDKSGHAQVVFEAPVISFYDNSEVSRSKWKADISFKYTNFSVDQSLDINNAVARFFGLTGRSLKASGERRKVVPMTFIVSEYKVKELLE